MADSNEPTSRAGRLLQALRARARMAWVGSVVIAMEVQMFNEAQLRPTLPAKDMARAKTWYAEKMGLQPVEENELEGAWYETGGARFLLYPSNFAGTNKATAASMTVDDFDSAIESLRENGVSFHEFEFDDFNTADGVLTLPDGRRAVWFNDSEGNILNILSD